MNQITKAVIERVLGVEMAAHLGYEKGDPGGAGSGNSRNGRTSKTVTTTSGPVRLEVPRDRNGSFDPTIVPKRRRRLGQVDDMVLSLYAWPLSWAATPREGRAIELLVRNKPFNIATAGVLAVGVEIDGAFQGG